MAHIADIPTTVRRVIAEHLGLSADEVRPEALLIEDLAADSLDVVELTLALDDEFGIDLDDDDSLADAKTVEALTVQALTALCERHVAKKTGAA